MRFATALTLVAAMMVARPSLAADAARGKTLYQTYCIGCHGFPPAGGPELAANNPTRIQAAINGVVGAMAFLKPLLTSTDIADIAAYIATIVAVPPPTTIVPAFDFSDLWWNANESGWGLNVVQHASGNIFAVMYTYESPNRPLWLVIPGGTWRSPLQFTGNLYRVTGPLASAFDPSRVGVRQVGTATLAFTDRNNGTFTFTVDGATVVKSITRQPF